MLKSILQCYILQEFEIGRLAACFKPFLWVRNLGGTSKYQVCSAADAAPLMKSRKANRTAFPLCNKSPRVFYRLHVQARQAERACQYGALKPQPPPLFIGAGDLSLNLLILHRENRSCWHTVRAALLSPFTKVTGINWLLTLHIVNRLIF